MLSISLLILLFTSINSGISKPGFFSNSLMGEYFVNWKYAGLCGKHRLGTNEIQINLKIHKDRKNKSIRMTGNYTLNIPWDKSITMNNDLTILDSKLPWLPNTYKFSLTGCSNFIKFLRSTDLLQTMNIPQKCSIPKGIYYVKEFDPDRILNHDSGSLIPRQFFYGTYQIIVQLARHGKTVGCSLFVLDLSPLWQKRKP